MSFKHLNLAIDSSGIAFITLKRTEQHNAFDDVMLHELSEVLDKLNRLDEIRVVILKAEGKTFCAGADVAWMQRMKHYDFPENIADAKQFAALLHKLYIFPKVTMALVQGPAFGGGVGLIACCDMVLTSQEANFCFSEVKLGLIPAVISPYIIRAIGENQTKRYFLTAEKFSAAQALTIGLVHEVVESSELLNRGYALAQQMLTFGPQALKAAKKLVQTIAGHSLSHGLIEQTVEEIATIRVSEEAQEGLQAFLEKRPPHW